MDILINVVGQKLKLSTNLKTLVSGTQEFVRFIFTLPDKWDDLVVFAQFRQDGVAYNQYLDTNNSVYLPPEIGTGTCTLMLYGSLDNVIATTNYITFDIDENILVSDAQSTEISTSLYNQLVSLVNSLGTFNEQGLSDLVEKDRYLQSQINTKANRSDLTSESNRAKAAEQANANAILLKADQSQVDALEIKITELENDEVITGLINSAVQEEIANYLEAGTLANLVIADSSITRNKVDSDFEDTLQMADTAMQPSVYDVQNLGVDVYMYAQGRADTVQNNLEEVKSEIRDAYNLTDSLVYTKIGDSIRGAVTLSRAYTQALLADYKAFTVTIVDELPIAGDSMTFYLVPNASNGYDKYWWITDSIGNSQWDVFGGSTTKVVSSLPEVGEEDIDYILRSEAGCLYYKYIDGFWNVVAGSIADVVSTLPEIGNEFTDYYVLNDSGVYVHYRYINGNFHSIGTETYTSDELNVMFSGLREDIDRNITNIETNTTNISSLSRTIDRVAQDLNNLDVEGLSYYASLSSEGDTYTYTLYEVDGDVETVKSQFVLPSGGSGGASSTTNLEVEKITSSPIISTPTDNVIIQISYSSTDTDGEFIDGSYVWKSGSSTIMTGSLIQGINTFDLTDYVSIGTQKLTLTVTDEGGSVSVKSWTVQIVDVRLESSFNDKYLYDVGRSVNFTYTPYGSVSKTVHFKLDGVELESVSTTASGTLQSYTLEPQTHGAHLLECWITATVNSVDIETSHIFKDIVWYDSESTVPIISCIYRYDYYGEVTAKQYNTTTIPYNVYDPNTGTPTVTLAVDGETSSVLKLTDISNSWAYKSDEVSQKTLTITCRETTLTVVMNIIDLGVDITPITANLDFDFNPVGLSNSSVNRLWVDENNPNVALTVSDNFDWNNGGYQLDDNGNQYFCVKSGTRAYISYNLFENNPKQSGAEFKLIFKTTNVRDNQTTFLSCMPTEDTIKVGLEMNAHEAYVHSSTSDLYIPYSEEDVIEFEYNINPLDTENPDATSYIMSYEDGVGLRPLIYDDSHRLYQYTPVPITIGSDDCDVHIYRMKSYSSSLTDSNILSNFIADSMDSDIMIDRYNRNQIYDENNTLTPDSVANACPDLRIIKIECPHFTNDKKDYVKNTSVECVYKNGDPVLDNWKFTNGYHAGQGTTSNEYGFAGRNIDIIFGFDGQHQVVSNIPLDTSYITELTLGDGTKYIDGSGKISLSRTSVPNNWFNIKVNIASSENANNALLQKRYNDYLPYKTPGQNKNPYIKNSMEFFNCVIFVKESDSDITTHREFEDTNWHFYGIGNIGDSKKTDNTRVNDPTDIKEFVVEVSDNTLPNSWFQTGVYLDANENITYNPDEAVSMVYPITTEQWNNENNLKRISLYDAWDDSFEFRYDMGTKDGETISDAEIEAQQEASKQVWRDMYEWVITSTDEEFVSDMDNWFIKESPLYWYLFTERWTMIDNRSKNSFWHWGKTYISTEEAVEYGDDAQYYTIDDEAASINNGYRFDLWDYDNDTALGINNSGELTLTYGKEDIDYKVSGDASSGYVYNAAESVFWKRIRNLMYPELQAMYLDRESAGCWSANSTITEFDNWQSQFPEELWRLDIERKYLRTYQAGTVRFLNSMMNGRKKYQRRQFERDQDPYIGTKYIGTTVKADQIMFRCNTPQSAIVAPDYTLRIVPYSDMYLTVLYGNSPAPKQIRAKAGIEYEITTELTEMDDTAILIYCASRIQELNDLSACYIHDNDFSKASKLKVLIIGNTTEGYSNSFLTSLNMGNNVLLETLDVRNCPNLTGSINLSSCKNLINLYAQGTSITSVLFATNGKIQSAYLPETINGLTLRNLNYLTNLNVASYDNLETFVCEYSIVDSLSILNEAYDTIQTLRLLGIDWTLVDTTLLNNILRMNSSTLSGTVYVAGAIRNNEINNYHNAWSDLEVRYNSNNLVTQYIVTFVNYDGTTLSSQYVDRGSAPYDPITAGDISTPIHPSDAQFSYTYTGWDDLDSIVLANKTITAQFSSEIRTYTVTWYAGVGQPLASVTTEYGTEVVYPNELPTKTDEENTYVYNVFSDWDKSTGYITGNLDVYAVWERAELPTLGTELKDMSIAQIYGVSKSGNTGNYFEAKDYFDIQLGIDHTYSNVPQAVIAENMWFDGYTAYDTGIKLFDRNERTFTMAIEYEYYDTSTANATILSCFDSESSEGFRIRYASNPQFQWGDKNENIGLNSRRGIVVIRHEAGSNDIYLYVDNVDAPGRQTNSMERYAYNIKEIKTTRTRSTSTEATIVLGAIKYLVDGAYDNYATGWIHWCKIWYADLGDSVAKELSNWIHETLRFEFIDTGRYRLSGTNTSEKTGSSFICNNTLTYGVPMTYTDISPTGWEDSVIREFCNNRFYNAIPYNLRSIIKKVKIPSTYTITGEILNSEDYIYIPSRVEIYNITDSPYIDEGYHIPWFTDKYKRNKSLKFIQKDDCQIFTGGSDPTTIEGNTVNAGDIWFEGYGYLNVFVPNEYLSKHVLPIIWYNDRYKSMASDGSGVWFCANNGIYTRTRQASTSDTNKNYYSINSYGDSATYSSVNVHRILPCFSI